MRSKLMIEAACFLAAMSLPFAEFAKPRASNTPSSSTEASALLTRLHQDAVQVKASADHLAANELAREADEFGTEANAGWDTDAITLDAMRDQINQMDQITYRLRNMESQLTQEQRSEIDNTTPAMLELTNTVQTAIQYLDNRTNLLAFAPYSSYAREMFSEVGRVERVTPST